MLLLGEAWLFSSLYFSMKPAWTSGIWELDSTGRRTARRKSWTSQEIPDGWQPPVYHTLLMVVAKQKAITAIVPTIFKTETDTQAIVNSPTIDTRSPSMACKVSAAIFKLRRHTFHLAPHQLFKNHNCTTIASAQVQKLTQTRPDPAQLPPHNPTTPHTWVLNKLQILRGVFYDQTFFLGHPMVN